METQTSFISRESLVPCGKTTLKLLPMDVTHWWEGLSTLLKSCFTATRVNLEVNKDDPDSIKMWSISSAADILSNSEEKCRGQVLHYVADNIMGLRVLLQNMEEVGSVSSKRMKESVSKILREIVNPRNGKLRTVVVNQAISINYIPTSIHILKNLLHQRSHCKISEEMEIVESTIVHFLWFFAAASTNDSSFARTVREMLKVKFLHNEVYKKIFFAKTTSHYPLLKILRQLTRTPDTAIILGKEGVMNTLRKSLTIIGMMPSAKLIIVFDMLVLLTKKRIGCTRFHKAGLLIKVIQCFTNWELWRGKGLSKMARFIITMYIHMSRTKQGRKAMIKSDAILQIRKFCDACPSERTFDDLIQRVAGLVATCYRKDSLPLDDLVSPIIFHVPDSAGKVQECGSSSDDEGSEDEENNNSENGSGDELIASSDDEGEKQGCGDDDSKGESSDDDDDDDNENEDDQCGGNGDDDQQQGGPQRKTKILPPRRTSTASASSAGRGGGEGDQPSKSNALIVDDTIKLANYKKFFPEFEMTKQGLITRKVKELWSGPNSLASFLLDENLNETKKLRVGIPRSEHKYPWIMDHKDCQYVYWNSISELRRQYAIVANSVNHLAPFVKIAYPDFAFGYSLKPTETLLPTVDRSVLRHKIISYITRTVIGDPFRPKVVYCLDNFIKSESNLPLPPPPGSEPPSKVLLRNKDEKEIGTYNKKFGLEFESRFESGNLRKAIQISEREYDLLITSDINSRLHNQWFYFQVSNTQTEKPYTFNIINCAKTNSLFNYGMQPVYFSVTEATKGRPGWCRTGSQICYYKNGYKCVPTKKKKNGCKVYHTLSFSITFAHKGDVVYIAYHIPYTYSRLMVEINCMIKATEKRSDIMVKYDTLCQSLNKNDVPVLTITSPLSERYKNNREVIFLTSRVHPGETNSSWMMKGILEFLIFGKTSHVQSLLKKYVFKIIPMLNVEGVINGCHRCGLTSEDLNRCWKSPNQILHPTIFHTKMLIEYCCKSLSLIPALYCDLHGHSRRKNLFFYGCSFAKSWHTKDKLEPDDSEHVLTLPENMDRTNSAFSLTSCNYVVQKSRETTARVAIWRDYRIPRSYTLECSYCGCDRGPYKGQAIGTNHLLEIGKDLCKACLDL